MWSLSRYSIKTKVPNEEAYIEKHCIHFYKWRPWKHTQGEVILSIQILPESGMSVGVRVSKEKDTRSVFRRREPKNQTSSAEFDFEAP